MPIRLNMERGKWAPIIKRKEMCKKEQKKQDNGQYSKRNRLKERGERLA